MQARHNNTNSHGNKDYMYVDVPCAKQNFQVNGHHQMDYLYLYTPENRIKQNSIY